MLKTLPVKKFSPLTFALIWSPTSRGEKGSRCKSGAIPVAVSSFMLSDLHATVNRREGIKQRSKPEDLPDQATFILLSGERHEM
jgi:hypothetical protein